VSKTELVPLYYDGQNQSLPAAYFESRENIKKRRKAGELDGWYASNGRLFIIYVAQGAVAQEIEREMAGFNEAWSVRQSGGGPLGTGMLVWQMNTPRTLEVTV